MAYVAANGESRGGLERQYLLLGRLSCIQLRKPVAQASPTMRIYTPWDMFLRLDVPPRL